MYGQKTDGQNEQIREKHFVSYCTRVCTACGRESLSVQQLFLCLDMTGGGPEKKKGGFRASPLICSSFLFCRITLDSEQRMSMNAGLYCKNKRLGYCMSSFFLSGNIQGHEIFCNLKLNDRYQYFYSYQKNQKYIRTSETSWVQYLNIYIFKNPVLSACLFDCSNLTGCQMWSVTAQQKHPIVVRKVPFGYK